VKLPLPRSVSERLGNRVSSGQAVVLGLRPQVFEPVGSNSAIPPANPDRPTIPVTINVLEPLGDQMDVSCGTALHPMLVARVPATADLRPGQSAKFAVDMGRVHVFELGEFGVNLGRDRG
jgi:ABC-type sugar transport system ATPase subunit